MRPVILSPLNRLLAPALLAALTATTPALAQERPAKPASKPAAPAAKPEAKQQDTKQQDAKPAEAQPAQVVKSETEAFDFWTVSCDTLAAPVGARRCMARLPVIKSDTRQLVVLLTAMASEEGEQLVLQIPTSILVQRGGALILGDKTLPFGVVSCQPALCTGVLPLDAALKTQLGAAANAAISWTAIGGAPVKVDFALKGAARALQAAAPR
jgi:invasion protein IalB